MGRKKAIANWVEAEFNVIRADIPQELLTALAAGRIDKLGIIKVHAGLGHKDKGLIVHFCPHCGKASGSGGSFQVI